MGYPIDQFNTTQPLTFLMVLSSDHITGATGVTPTVTISKAAGAFATPAGAVTEVGNGVYTIAANATDADTIGPLWIHATATGCDPCDDAFDVEFNLSSTTALQTPSSSSAVSVSGIDIVTRAMKRLGLLNAGEVPTAEDASDGLESLNDMIDFFNAQHLMLPVTARTLMPLRAGVSTYSVGAGGDFDMPWPNGLQGCGVVWNTGTTILEWPISVLDPAGYQVLRMKLFQAPWPRAVYYQRTHPLGLLSVWPVKDSNYTIQLALYTQTALAPFAALTTRYTMQPAYRLMLVDNLAVRWASYFPVDVPTEVAQSAREAKAVVKAANVTLEDLQIRTPFNAGGWYNIYDDRVNH